MRHWDLNSGSAKLDQALKSLTVATVSIGESWDDKAYHAFVDRYVDPLQPRVRNVLNAIQRLAEVLSNAERELSTES